MSAEERVLDAGFEDVLLLKDFSYDDALIGVTEDGRAVYDYEKMVEWLMEAEGWSYDDSIDWIEYNTIGALAQFWTEDGYRGPIIMHRV